MVVGDGRSGEVEEVDRRSSDLTVAAPSVLVLGPVALQAPGSVPVALRGNAARILAAVVASHPRAVTRDELAEVLWPGGLPASSASAFRVHLSRLRRALADVGVHLDTDRTHVGLAAAPEVVDLLVAERLVAAVRRLLRSEGRPDDAVVVGRRVLGLFRGVPFDDLADDALLVVRTRADELRLDAEDLVAEADLVAGRHEEALVRLAAAVDAAPLRERRWHQLALALYRSGRPADALDVLHRARRTLAEQVGAAPGPDLSALERSMLVHDPALQLPEGRRGRADGRGRPAVVGRTSEMDAAVDAIVRGARVVAFVGAAGSGTSTALGAVLVERAPDLLDPVEQVVSLPSSIATDPDALRQAVGDIAAGVRTLLAVDLGGAADTSGAALAESLDVRPEVTALVAAARPLGCQGEVVVSLGPLPPVDAQALLWARCGPGVGGDDVAAIVEVVGGHPGSLVAAAGWVDVLGAPVVADGLRSGRLSLATSDGLVDAIDARRAQLEPAAASALAAAAAFRRSFDVAAVAAVGDLDLDAAAAALAAWRGAGLVEPDPGGVPGRWRLPAAIRDAVEALARRDGAAERAGRAREAFLVDLATHHGLAVYGLAGPSTVASLGPWHDELLLVADDALVRSDLDVAATVAEGLVWFWEAAQRTADGDRWFARAVAAVDRTPDHPAASRLLALAATSGPTSSRLVARADLAERAAALVGDDRRWAGLAGLSIAARQLWTGDTAGARATLDAAAGQIDPTWTMVAIFVDALGAMVDLVAGDPSAARTGLALVHERAADIASPFGQQMALLFLGFVADATGDVDLAIRCHRRAIAIVEDEGLHAPDHARIGLGTHLLASGRPTEAREPLRSALAGRLAVGDHLWAAEALCGLAEVEEAVGDRAQASALHRHALREAVIAGDRAACWRAGVGLARSEVDRGRPRVAAQILVALDAEVPGSGRPPRPVDLAADQDLRRRLGADPTAAASLVDPPPVGLAGVLAAAALDEALDATGPRRP